MSRLETLRVFGQIIFLAVAGAASVTLRAGGPGHALRTAPLLPLSSSQAYLLRVGPPNLRFDSGKVREKIAPTQYSLAKSSPSSIAAAPAPAGPADTKNSFPIPTNAAPVTSVLTKADATPAPASAPAFSLEPDGTDLSVSMVTPAMLADYLKPSASGKNSRSHNDGSPGDVVPATPGFTPPTPGADHQSHAVYKNE